MREIWVDIYRYKGLYQVSNFGRVKSFYKAGTILKQSYTGKYLKVDLVKNGKKNTQNVHRLVAKAFVPNPKRKKEVNHLDGNKFNNNSSNFAWVTPKENKDHYKQFQIRGEACPSAKLTTKEVRSILKSAASHRELAGMYGVSKSAITAIKTNKSWKHI